MMRPEQLAEYREISDDFYIEYMDLEAAKAAFDHMLDYTEHREAQRTKRAHRLRVLRQALKEQMLETFTFKWAGEPMRIAYKRHLAERKFPSNET